jgi:hypothetical protein
VHCRATVEKQMCPPMVIIGLSDNCFMETAPLATAMTMTLLVQLALIGVVSLDMKLSY